MNEFEKGMKDVCNWLGHCKEHKPCCFCIEAERFAKAYQSSLEKR